MQPIVITDHALQRWSERVGPVDIKKIRGLVRGCLRTQLRLGLKKDGNGDLEFLLPLFENLTAVVKLDDCWVVKTFRREMTG